MSITLKYISATFIAHNSDLEQNKHEIDRINSHRTPPRLHYRTGFETVESLAKLAPNIKKRQSKANVTIRSLIHPQYARTPKQSFKKRFCDKSDISPQLFLSNRKLSLRACKRKKHNSFSFGSQTSNYGAVTFFIRKALNKVNVGNRLLNVLYLYMKKLFSNQKEAHVTCDIRSTVI